MRIKLTDFSGGIREDKSDQLKGLGYPKILNNFSVADGSIRGVKNLEVDDSIGALIGGLDLNQGRIFEYTRFCFDTNAPDNKIIIFDSSFVGYYINLGAETKELIPLGVTFSSRPVMINYRLNGEDVVIMVSKTDNMVVWNGVDAPEIILDAPKIKSMDIHYERLFAATSGEDGSELKFSDDLDPTNWSESLSDAGSISFVDGRGAIIKVVSFCDYLFAFREFGITRVYANTSLQSNFYVNQLFVSGGRILGDTIAVAGDRIMFVATDGIYIFDGASTKRVLENIFPKIRITGLEEAAFFDGKYYLSCKILGENSSASDAVIRVDMDDFSVEIIDGIRPISMAPVMWGDKKSLYVLNGEGHPVCRFVEGEAENPFPMLGVFESGFYDFGTSKTKTITRVVVTKNENSSVAVKIASDAGEEFEGLGDGAIIDERMMLRGREFKLRLESTDPNVIIKSVEIEAGGL